MAKRTKTRNDTLLEVVGDRALAKVRLNWYAARIRRDQMTRRYGVWMQECLGAWRIYLHDRELHQEQQAS